MEQKDKANQYLFLFYTVASFSDNIKFVKKSLYAKINEVIINIKRINITIHYE